jgi:hypothetical protein
VATANGVSIDRVSFWPNSTLPKAVPMFVAGFRSASVTN